MSFTQDKERSNQWQLRVVCFLMGFSIALGAKASTDGNFKLQMAKLSKIEVGAAQKVSSLKATVNTKTR